MSFGPWGGQRGLLPPAQGPRREGCSAPGWFSLSLLLAVGMIDPVALAGRGTKIGCGLPAIHPRRAHLKPGETKVFSARQSPLRWGKKHGAYMMLSAELFIKRDIFRTFSWVSAARWSCQFSIDVL